MKVKTSDLLNSFKYKRLTTNEFVMVCNSVHDHYYSYNKTVYKSSKDSVTITCPVHGDFQQVADTHKSGRGCTKCGKVKTSVFMKVRQSKLKLSTDVFKERAEAKHGSLYDYSKVEFDLTSDKVTIVCPKHGDFIQEVTKHLIGSKCPKCCNEQVKNGWSTTVWKEVAKKSSNFNGFKLYIIKLYNGNEVFYKIGKTFRSIAERSGNIPYSMDVLVSIEASAEYVSKLEKELQSINKEHSYSPSKSFFGCKECFSKVVFKGITYED